MRSQFPIFQSHLDLAFQYWEKVVKPGDIVIDATCGNGQDTLRLARLALTEQQGCLYAIDIQSKAIDLTQQYLMKSLDPQLFSRVHLLLGCHSHFPESILPNSVKLIVYNLGYLPGGGNKQLTTLTETTLQSLMQAQKLVMPGGAISLTCYPGHDEGAEGENEILNYVKVLPPDEWNCCHHRWLNRKKAPSLLLLQKAIEPNKT